MSETFNCRPLQYKNISRYPYVDKFSIPGSDTKDIHMSTELIYQFAKKSFSYLCENIESISVADITGPPTFRSGEGYEEKKFFGQHTNLMQDRGHSSAFFNFKVIECEKMKIHRNFINLEYHEAVYPLTISVFGDIIGNRIWAKDSDDKWSLIWDNDCHEINFRSTEISLSLILWPCYFKTKILRLEYDCDQLRDSKITAVMLTGTTDLILPRSEQTNPDCLFDLLDKISPCHPRWISRWNSPSHNFEFAINIDTLENKDILQRKSPLIRSCLEENVIQWNCWNHYVIYESEIVETFHKGVHGYKHISHEIIPDHAQCSIQMYKHYNSYRNYLNYEKFLEDIKLLWEKSKKRSLCSFSHLPDEIIIKILEDLDLKALCRVSRVNKRLNNLSRNSELYKSLNVRNILYTYWRFDFDDILLYFTPRCKYLTQLDVSFCDFSVATFNKFLTTCGKLLTDLRLSYCPFINNSAVLQISKICKNLKGLDLNGCNLLKDKGLSHLENLKSLERLHLENVLAIRAKTLYKILQCNQQMRDLNLAYTFSFFEINKVVIRLKTLSLNLEKINLTDTSLTMRDIDVLADCKNLKEVNFRTIWWICEDTTHLRNGFHKLFSSCQRLEKIDLSYNHILTNDELETLTLCKNLKYLMLIQVPSVTPDICLEIFLHCPKLENIYLPHTVMNHLINQWNERYQHITISFF